MGAKRKPRTKAQLQRMAAANARREQLLKSCRFLRRLMNHLWPPTITEDHVPEDVADRYYDLVWRYRRLAHRALKIRRGNY